MFILYEKIWAELYLRGMNEPSGDLQIRYHDEPEDMTTIQEVVYLLS